MNKLGRKKKEKYNGFVTEYEQKAKEKADDIRINRLRRELDIKEKKKAKKKKESKYRRQGKNTNKSSSGIDKNYIEFISPVWCCFCIHAVNVFDAGLKYAPFYHDSYHFCKLRNKFTKYKLNIPAFEPYDYIHPFCDSCDDFVGNCKDPMLSKNEFTERKKHGWEIDEGEQLDLIEPPEKIHYCTYIKPSERLEDNCYICDKYNVKVLIGCNKCDGFDEDGQKNIQKNI